MKCPKKLVRDMMGKSYSIDDNHKAIEGGECKNCGIELTEGTGNVCTTCHKKYRAERLSKRYK